MEQAAVLRKFIQGVESMRTGDQLGEDNFGTDFMRLRRLSTKYRTEKIYPTNVGEKEENVKKNRYKDILPFDHSRVKVSLKTSNQDSDYINANFIKGMEGPETYIATQGPLPNTIIDFWRMNWEYNVTVIIMACREFEMGRKKCERYFPMFGDEPMTFGPFKISCESEQARPDYYIRCLTVEYENESRRIAQFHYINWPDHDVPSSFDSILDMIGLMREEHQQHTHTQTPICVHCSAGCGRTGAICAIDYTWNLLKAGKIPEDFNVFRLIQEMRTQRHSAVQTKEQYELVHRAIAQLFQKQLRILESPSTDITDDITDGLDGISPEKPAQNSDEERWDTPPPKPPRIRSAQGESDVREEILQPPEPRPVPPILTPSPPSAFPTVTSVAPATASDRYHPKPVLHVLATANKAAAQGSAASPSQTSASAGSSPDADQNRADGPTMSPPNATSPTAQAPSSQPPTSTTTSATSPVPGSSPECRVERKLSIEIKKVPLQEGPVSFQQPAAGVTTTTGANAGSGSASGGLQRGHAFKSKGPAPSNNSSNSGSPAPSNNSSALTSSSSLSEDSGVETGGEGGGGGNAPPRPNHLPLAEKETTGTLLAEKEKGAGTGTGTGAGTGTGERVLGGGSHATWGQCSSSCTPTPEHRTALSFTNPLHSDNSDLEADLNLDLAPSLSLSHSPSPVGSSSAATAAVSLATVGTSPTAELQQQQHRTPSPRRVNTLSLASQPVVTHANSDASEDTPPPLPERTPDSFLLPSDPCEPAVASWSCGPTDQHSTEGVTSMQTKAASEASPGANQSSPGAGQSKDSSSPAMGFGSRGMQPKGPRNPPFPWS
ncbi:tyrosine-protein phosphatase non-receptor type 12 [Engraulis encrasicolus]|uniref:tyrosine-protein phosphatase non-receptor type 12 n=1 Tax=Engraulis encrasicolus TaxID=184585 RepID=UPI002FD6C8A3